MVKLLETLYTVSNVKILVFQMTIFQYINIPLILIYIFKKNPLSGENSNKRYLAQIHLLLEVGLHVSH